MLPAAFALLSASLLHASDAYPPPRFTDPDRVRKLESTFPETDRIFRDYAEKHKIPGMAWGIVIDGRLAHTAAFGVRDRVSGAPVTDGTVFRIASMTKSFTALAVLQLRDEGKLSLDDPVSKWLPEWRIDPPTRDSAPVTVRHLLSHSAGLPEDNPWGDRQLGATDERLTGWLRDGMPFSTPPGTRYEYSNYAFGLLGRIVSRASGVAYEKYVEERILAGLHMDSSTFEFARAPRDRRATGYRREPDGSYREEPPLPHGAFGAMGGLLTTARDLGRYVAFHLAAWPPRDDPDPGPVRRASVREMAHLWTPSNLTASAPGGRLQVSASGYGYGLRIASDCRFEHIAGHGGGLPGFGSYMMWLPDYGVGLFAMANLTYSGPAEPMGRIWDVMLKSGGLRRRELPPSPMLTTARERILRLWKSWDDAEADRMAAMNLFLDIPAERRRAEIEELKAAMGECTAGPLLPENWLRGQFNLSCAGGTVGVFFTLAPTLPPAVQHLAFRRLDSSAVRLAAPTGAPAGVSCRE